MRQRIRPWVLDPDDPSAPALRGIDHVNNVEQITVKLPTAGEWEIQVLGTNVPGFPRQRFTLVGLDQVPPAPVGGFDAAASGDSAVALTWTGSTTLDTEATLIVRSLSPVGWTPSAGSIYAPGVQPAPGITVVADAGGDFSQSPLLDGSVASGVVYHYAAFARDGMANYAPPAADSALADPGSLVAASEPASRPVPEARLALGVAGPNPFNPRASLRLALPVSGDITVTVYDPRGRRVRDLFRGRREAGVHGFEWDGKDEEGRSAASGAYFVRAATPAGAVTAKILLVR
jgi:hypothetical protein